MIGRNFAKAYARKLVWSLALTAPSMGLSEPDDGAARLQADAISRISHWRDYVRRTGDARSTVSELETAQAELKTSYDRFLRVNQYAQAAWSAIQLADTLRYLSRWADAVPVYLQADQLAQKAARPDYETKALARLAFSEMNTKQLDSAAGHVQKAVRLGAGCGNQDFFFDALDTAGEVEIARGNLPAASDYVDRALAIGAHLSDKRQLYNAYADRADIYYQKAQTYDCQKQYDVCFEAYEHSKADYLAAQSVAQQAGYTYLVQQYTELIQGADGQMTVLKQLQSGYQSLSTTMFDPKLPKDVTVSEFFASGPANSANAELLKKEIKDALDYMALTNRLGSPVQDLDPADYWARGSLAEMNGDEPTALMDYRRALQLVEQDRRSLKDEQARKAFLEDKSYYFYKPALLLLQQKKYAEAFSLFEQSRSRAMADMLFNHKVTLGTAQERELFSQLVAQRTVIAANQQNLFALTSSPSRDQNGQKLAHLEHEIEAEQQKYEQLETNVARQAPALKNLTHSEPATLESVQRAAARGGFDLLYYVVCDTGIILWHVNGTGVQVRNVFLPRSQLMIKVTSLRDSLESGPDAPFDELHARQLYLYLIQPVAQFLNGRRLVIVPHEELNSIPFQTLLDPGTGKYLGETYAISYAPSATVLETLAPTDALKRGRLLAVADSGLSAATGEVRNIGKLYPNRSKVAESATKSELKSWVGDYNVIHLSMHGKFNERDPLLSYLQLKPSPSDDGRLTAAEMFGLPLEKNSIAVLSACETGRVKAGHANEVEGIVRALLYAGAGTLVLSAWKVDAAATSSWMEAFYREGQTKPPPEAARLALIAVKNQPKYSHPYYWAPFVLTGK